MRLFLLASSIVFALWVATASAQVLDGFTGFSRDGKSFAWVSRSNILPDLQNLYVIGVGSDRAQSYALDINKEKAQGILKSGGFDNKRRPLPSGVTVTANIYKAPATVTITRNGKSTTQPLDPSYYPESDTWEVWGVDASGKNVAIHIFGKPVEGVFGKPKGGTLHFYRVVPLR
jgi:hypothetical protein